MEIINIEQQPTQQRKEIEIDRFIRELNEEAIMLNLNL